MEAVEILQARGEADQRGLVPGESLRRSFLILDSAEHFLHIQDTGCLSPRPPAFFFWPCHKARKILVPQPGIESMSPTLEACSLNHQGSPSE